MRKPLSIINLKFSKNSDNLDATLNQELYKKKFMELSRCHWPKADADMIAYHDTEWGTPVHDDRKLFEFMILDAFQAGLSWSTILRKRENFRHAFAGFYAEAIARFDDKDVERLMNDAGIIRNRLKILASIDNARAFLKIVGSHGSFDAFIWQFTGGKTITNHWTEEKQIPVTSPEAERMSAELKANGFRFVGPTICYSFMQAAGMVNDHLVSCFRWKEVGEQSRTKSSGADIPKRTRKLDFEESNASPD